MRKGGNVVCSGNNPGRLHMSGFDSRACMKEPGVGPAELVEVGRALCCLRKPSSFSWLCTFSYWLTVELWKWVRRFYIQTAKVFLWEPV